MAMSLGTTLLRIAECHRQKFYKISTDKSSLTESLRAENITLLQEFI